MGLTAATAFAPATVGNVGVGFDILGHAFGPIGDRVRAERAAMQAPVKLLVPLLLCIFPCTFIVIAVPIAARFIAPGGP